MEDRDLPVCDSLHRECVGVSRKSEVLLAYEGLNVESTCPPLVALDKDNTIVGMSHDMIFLFSSPCPFPSSASSGFLFDIFLSSF